MPAQVPPEVCWKPLRYRNDRWTDPATGIVIEKDILRNVEQRRHLLARCREDREAQHLMMLACRESFLTFCNLFCWTFHQISHGDKGRAMERGNKHFPFITWPVQDDAAEELIAATGLTGQTGETVVLDKSREMGATWLSLAIIVWLWLFHPDVSILMCADRGDAVESTGRTDFDPTSGTVAGNPDTLFWKIDYILTHLPAWMRPRLSRVNMHLQNLDNGSVIDGSTTRDNLGRGGRRALVFVDEASAIRNLRSIDESTQDTAASRWFNATPRGAHYFSELRSGGKSKVIVLGWWDHPEKGCDGPNGEPGRYIAHDDEKQEEVITGWWRELEKGRRQSLQDVAQNIDIDHLGAGRVFFDLGVLNRHLATYTRPPDYCLALRHKFDGRARDISIRKRKWRDVIVEESDNTQGGQGRLYWWGELVSDGRGGLRPPQDRLYIAAADVSTGNSASNSVISILDRNTGQKVGEWVSASVSPDGLARTMAMLGLWLGGITNEAWLIWENNGGQGSRVGRVLARRLAYPNLYTMEILGRQFANTTDVLGWTNSRNSKREGMEHLRAAYAGGEFFNPSAPAVQEAMKYTRYDGGGIGPGPLEFESIEAQETHGDRVIADMLLVIASMIDLPLPTKPKIPHDPGTMDLVEAMDREDQEAAMDDDAGDGENLDY